MKKSETLKAIYELAKLAEVTTAEVVHCEALDGADERELDKALPKKREVIAMRIGIINAFAAAYALLDSEVEDHGRIDYEYVLAKMYDQCIEELVVMRTGYKRRTDD